MPFEVDKIENIKVRLVCSLCYKNVFGGNLDLPKIKKLTKKCSMSVPAQKGKNNAIFKQN